MNKKLILICAVFLLIGFVFSSAESIIQDFGIDVVEDIGDLIGDGLNLDDVSVKGVQFTKKDEISTIAFIQVGSSANINKDLYQNIDVNELAYIKLNNAGEILSADLTASEETIFTFDEKNYEIPKGGRIFYENGKTTIYGNSFELKEESSNDFAKIDLIGKSINISKDEEENSVLFGNFKIGENEFKGLSEEGLGQITLNQEGKIIKLGENTHAIIDKIIYQTEKELILEGDANSLREQSKNYFISQEGQIKTGGSGFTVNLQEGNSVFPELDLEKYVLGSKVPKKGDFEVMIQGGDLEIKKSSGEILAFDVKGEGRAQIKNGRVAIIFEEDLISGKQKIMAKTDSSMELTYDMNINDGKYVLEDFVFKGDGIEINHNLPWENTLKKGQRVHKTETTTFIPKDLEGNPLKDEFGNDAILTDSKSVLLPKFQEISDKIEKERGIRPRRYDLYVDDANDEALVKWAFEDTAWINKNNKHGITVSPEEVAAVSLQEYFSSPDARETYLYYKDSPLESTALGLDFIGNAQTIASRKEAGFFHPDLELLELGQKWVNELGQTTTVGTFKNVREGFAALVGEYGYRKYQALETYREYYGEDALNKLTESQKTQLAYYTYNCGLGCLQKAMSDVNEKIFKTWDGDVYGMSNARHNSQMLTASVEFLQKSEIFNHP